LIVREENAAAALEVMSRFAFRPEVVDLLAADDWRRRPTSRLPGLLEHPGEVFAYFREEGVPRVVCEEKHMGSRAVVIVCRDEEAARRRFGIRDNVTGICYTRHRPALFSTTAPARRSCWPTSARPSTPPASGKSSTPTGSASTAN